MSLPFDDERRESYETTDNGATYRKLHKRYFAACDRCPWHEGDNVGRRPARTSWKRSRRQRWRPREVRATG